MKRLAIVALIIVGAVIVLFTYRFMRIEPLEEADTMNQTETAVLETSMGTIEIELLRDKAPITVENFVGYVKEGHFDGTVFHRVMSDFMIQGGGFLPNGTQKKTRAPITLESRNGLSNTRGTVAMARTMIPDSATSQFFINVVDNKKLDYRPGNDGYAVFGRVTKGMDVADRIRAVGTGSRGPHGNWPVEDILITRASMR